MYLFILILSVFYFIFGWKHNSYDKYKHESFVCLFFFFFLYKLNYIQLMPKQIYIILNFNYPIVNTLS